MKGQTESAARRSIVPIFAGGGTRLPAHIGILAALQKLNLSFDRVVGVSGGSIIASLYACGKSMDEIRQISIDTDFEQFRGFSLMSLIRNGGLCSGDKFETWLDKLLEGVTFAELPFELHIVATDVRNGIPVVFDKSLTPDLKVSRAVRYSMSIPLVFAFKPYEDHLMVDGSILSEDALHRDWADDGTPVICFRLRGEADNKPIETDGLFPVVNYVLLLIRTFMTTISREYVNDKFWHRTVVINTGNSSPVDFRLTEEDKMRLFQVGYDTTLEVLPAKIFPKEHESMG